MLIVVRREHRLRYYKKKGVLELCVTIAKHRVILLLVRLESKTKQEHGWPEKPGWVDKVCQSLRLVTTFLCDFSASVRGAVRGK